MTYEPTKDGHKGEHKSVHNQNGKKKLKLLLVILQRHINGSFIKLEYNQFDNYPKPCNERKANPKKLSIGRETVRFTTG